ncbi:hypothetical protein ABZ671_18825 [Micromonospora sp. NPDC006766]|uniref:hypothetical protein n=1 Tax=Micromonospora sp. NPDC006766 TaxID=3154778 RepID=UPI0033CE841D
MASTAEGCYRDQAGLSIPFGPAPTVTDEWFTWTPPNPVLPDNMDGGSLYALAVRYEVGVLGKTVGVRFRVPLSGMGSIPQPRVRLYSTVGPTLLASKDFSVAPAAYGTDLNVRFDSPVPCVPSTLDEGYYAVLETNRYVATTQSSDQWGRWQGHLYAYNQNGWIGSVGMPPATVSGNRANYYVSPIFVAG